MVRVYCRAVSRRQTERHFSSRGGVEGTRHSAWETVYCLPSTVSQTTELVSEIKGESLELPRLLKWRVTPTC